MLVCPRSRGDGTELGSSELCQGTLQVNQGIGEELEVILSHTIRTSPTRHKTELAGLILGSKLSYAVIWPPVDFHASVDHHDGLAVELNSAVASEVANICGRYGRELCRREEKVDIITLQLKLGDKMLWL